MSIFSNFLEDIMEVFMDDFSMYGYSFDRYLINLEKVSKMCVKANLMLNSESYHFMVKEGEFSV